MYNPEKSIIEKEDNNAIENVDYILDHQISKRIDMSSFGDVYDQKIIDNDKNYVSKMKDHFKETDDQLTSSERNKVEERKMKSEALEVIISEQGTLSGWFEGEDTKCSISRTCEYDDIKNGTDGVMEFEIADDDGKNIKRIALAIDASMSADSSVLDRKLKRNIEKIKRLEDLEVKYFQSDLEDYKGNLKGVMPIVFALDGENTNDLINLVAQNKRLMESGRNPEIFEKTKKELDNHACQQIFLREAKIQFEAYIRELNKMSDPKAKETVKKTEQDLEVIKKLIDSKKDIYFDNLAYDKSFSRMKELLTDKEKPAFST